MDNFNSLNLPLYASTGTMAKKISHFFDVPISTATRSNLTKDAVYLGWGYKEKAQRLRRNADSLGAEYYACEDGFFAYLNHSSNSSLMSICMDDLGIYYDGTSPSRLEKIISCYSRDGFDDNKRERARLLCQQIRETGASKYNLVDSRTVSSPTNASVIVVDQVSGDLSIALSGADEATFSKMLQVALEENPNDTIYVKRHPDVVHGTKKGCIRSEELQHERVQTLDATVTPREMLDSCNTLYTVCSQLGFDALVHGVAVSTFGVPFYSGWGLTKDYADQPVSRRGSADIDQLVHAAIVDYCLYVHPETTERCSPEDVLSYIALQQSSKVYGKVLALDFSPWKQAFLPTYLRKLSKDVVFCSQQNDNISADSNDAIVIWGNSKPPSSVCGDIYRIEDGFIRSVGLGVDFSRPSSLVLDGRGIYFDSSKESDLEWLLNNRSVSKRQEERAEKLIELLVESKVSKYNVGGEEVLERLKKRPQKKKAILVVGQVESDASLAFGSPYVQSNLELLEAVRNAEPEAFIVYKPHPDVISGNRKGDIDVNVLEALADLVIEEASIIDVIELVDAVHTMTSLAGFEALIRGRDVTCYGQPFYSGWGLTKDLYPLKRRSKKHSLASLVYFALIEYPLYVDWSTDRFCTPEFLVARLKGDSASVARKRSLFGTIFSLFRKAKFLTETFMPKRQRGKNL